MGEDYFEALGLERGLDCAPEVLRARYDERCREIHPDAGGDSAEFQRLHRAYVALQSPGRRLRHWLESAGVDGGERGDAAHEAAELFDEVGALLQRCSEIGRRRKAAQSVLGQSLAEREAIEVLAEVERLREKVQGAIKRLTSRFEEFEKEGAETCAERAAATAGGLIFLEKWERRLREAWTGLAG